MLTDSVKSRFLYLIAVVIGGIGAFGQAYLLYHELAECYPYKMMSFPSADYYKTIAKTGIYVAPLIAVVISLFFKSKIWKVPAAAAVLCPLLFVGIFKLTSVLYEWNGIVETGKNFDGSTSVSVAQGFFISATGLSITGLIVGLICGLILSKFDSVKKLS